MNDQNQPIRDLREIAPKVLTRKQKANRRRKARARRAKAVKK